MKLNFNVSFKDLLGQSIIIEGEPANIGKMLGQALASSNEGDALKMFDWAMKLYAGTELDLDRSDYDKMKSFINVSKVLSNLQKGQMLEIMKEFNK